MVVIVPLEGVEAKLKKLNVPSSAATENNAQVTTARPPKMPDREVDFFSIKQGVGC